MTRPLFLLAAVALAGAARADTRTFAVTVDGRPSGTVKMAAAVADDGTTTVATTVDIRAKILLVHYTYTLQSHEVWKAGRVVSLEAYANDDGKRYAVKAAAAGDGLSVTANGKTRAVRGDVITSTGWVYPGDGARDAVVLDTENGSEIPARIDPLPPARVTAGGQPVEAKRLRVTGRDMDSVWWFDPANRPVRQEQRWDGHRVVLELTSVAR